MAAPPNFFLENLSLWTSLWPAPQHKTHYVFHIISKHKLLPDPYPWNHIPLTITISHLHVESWQGLHSIVVCHLRGARHNLAGTKGNKYISVQGSETIVFLVEETCVVHDCFMVDYYHFFFHACNALVLVNQHNHPGKKPTTFYWSRSRTICSWGIHSSSNGAEVEKHKIFMKNILTVLWIHNEQLNKYTNDI